MEPPSDHPVRGERGGVAPGRLREISVVFLLIKQPIVARSRARNAARGVPSLWFWGGRGQVLSDAAIWVSNSFF